MNPTQKDRQQGEVIDLIVGDLVRETNILPNQVERAKELIRLRFQDAFDRVREETAEHFRQGLYAKLHTILAGLDQALCAAHASERDLHKLAKEWAADDRKWTTQETVEINLLHFADALCAAHASERDMSDPDDECDCHDHLKK